MNLLTTTVDQTIISVEIPIVVIEVTLAGGENTSTGGTGTLIHPNNPNTKITFDADLGLTITTDKRITLKNTVTGDEANYG